MTATTTDAAPEKATRPITRESAFIRRVAAAHHAGGTAALRRWRPGDIDASVIALTQDATPQEYPAWALVAKLFILTNRGGEESWYGENGNGIGRWAFWAKPRDNTGKADRQMERILTTLTRAESFDEIARALTALATATTQTTPNWHKVLTEVVAWTDPSQRGAVRYRWAQDFYTPKKKAPVAAS